MLHVRARDGTVRTADIGETPLKVGRSDRCDIILQDDGEVSRFHAEIWLNDGRLMVADLNSKNGTRVDSGPPFHNATRVAKRRVLIGEHVLELGGAAAADGDATLTFSNEEPTGMGGTSFFPSSRRLDLNRQRLDLLMSLAERLSGAYDLPTLLNQAIDACCEALGFERGLIALRTARGEPENPVTRNIQRDENGAFKISRTLINRALVDGERAIVNNPATDLQGAFTESMVRFPICSALCVPIRHRDEILGVVYGDKITSHSVYSPNDVDFFAAIAQQVGLGLANLRMVHERARTERILAELKHARTIQRMLLPPAALTKGRITIEGFNEPSSAVGGDYFDFFEVDQSKLGVIIADVTGHGLPAALLMANLQAAVRVAMSEQTHLPRLVARVNRLMCRNTAADVFITAAVGVVDTETGVLDLVNAGHPGPMVFGREARLIPDDLNSLPLGIDPDEKFEVRRIEPEEGEHAVMFFTDGMHEAAGAADELLGVSPVLEAIAALNKRTTSAMIRTTRAIVRKHLAGGANSDDMTFMAMHYRGA
jgi:serine phosphatase RsbU (regulator of sigma subunit)